MKKLLLSASVLALSTGAALAAPPRVVDIVDSEVALLSTCNRVEAIVVTADPARAAGIRSVMVMRSPADFLVSALV